ncbi:DegT/DnrJ/EryC1/StrS family aminotransferase [Sunxiuqinia sp. sy24]|uniref:DegT/DnrJ/EryC1/StrS family aminotransferase n=1 Tax=Sunxiuqinia sp. sy24 TaxID=3461495 RepID=UPI0040456A48
MISLYKPFMPDQLPELENILHSGALAYGQWGKEFERELSAYVGCPNIISVNSFNAAMLVSLTTFGIKTGDEVIASPMSCLASNQPFATIGAKVIWADIDPKTGTLDPESVRKRITPKTKAIFHNHHCGYPGYIDEINSIGREKGIYIIDDAIEAFGSRYKGKIIGNTGSDATVFSFQTVRLPNTIDGGAITFKDKELFAKAKLVRDFGVDRSNFRNELGEISSKCDVSTPGYGVTLSEINSYIGCLQIDQTDALLKLQRQNAHRWQNEFANKYPQITPLGNGAHEPNFWIYGILSPTKKETIINFREKGYYASGVHLPNNYYSVFGASRPLKGVEDFYSKFVAIPCGWWFSL